MGAECQWQLWALVMSGLSVGTIVSLTLWLTVLTAVIVVAVLGVRRFRDSNAQDQRSPTLGLANLQEMAERGDISDTEYRTIKAVLGARLRQGISSEEKKG